MDFWFIIDSLPRLWPGLLLTVKLSLVSLSIAAIFGLPIGILRAETKNRYTALVIDIYVFLVRGTPILVQVYAAYFLLPMLGFNLSPFWTGIVALVFNSAGYQVEIVRASLLSIDKGQREGARSLGISNWLTLILVLLPQAFPRMLPAIANEISNLIKASSVLSVIAVFELHKSANAVISQSYKFLEMLLAQAFLYVAFVVLLTQLARWLETRQNAKINFAIGNR